MTATDVFEAAIAIKGDKIAAIGPEALLPPADRVIDAQGKYVLPGLIDCHLHVGPEYDDWKTAPLAAARTGLTTLLPFVTYDEGETLPRAAARLREEASALSVLDFGFHFILNHEPHILEGIAETFRMGVTSFKLFMTYKKRPKRMVSDEFIAKTMEQLASPRRPLPAPLRERRRPLLPRGQGHRPGPDGAHRLSRRPARTGPRKRRSTAPSSSVGSPTARCTWCISRRELGLERIKRAQAEGQKVWTETCPQYLLLTDKEMQRLGPFAKIGPPLRPADGPDRAALWAGSEAGFIATVASDHSPRVPAAKEPGHKNIFVDPEGKPIPFGAPSLETLVPLHVQRGRRQSRAAR